MIQNYIKNKQAQKFPRFECSFLNDWNFNEYIHSTPLHSTPLHLYEVLVM